MERHPRHADNPAAAVSDDIRDVLRGKSFASLEEANAFLADYMRQRNQHPVADFQGLSSEQMHRLLSFPFDSPQLVTFADAPAEAETAPIMRLFIMLVAALGESGLKATATGNLPRNLVRASALSFWGETHYREYTQFGEPRTESEFGDLHITRLVAEMAGLIRREKGMFHLTRKCRARIARAGLAGVYPLLLRTFVTRFNWAYHGWRDELPIIQHSFLFTLYLLHRFGDQWRATTFYADAFLRAFPQTLHEATPNSYMTTDSIVRENYTLRALEHFAVFLGLAEMRPVGDPQSRQHEIRRVPLLDMAVPFHLP
jgi:hypothetical protein